MRKIIVVLLCLSFYNILNATDPNNSSLKIIGEYESKVWIQVFEDNFKVVDDFKKLNLDDNFLRDDIVKELKAINCVSNDCKELLGYLNSIEYYKINVDWTIDQTNPSYEYTLSGLIAQLSKKFSKTKKEKLDSIFSKAKNDFRLICLLENKSECLSTVIEEVDTKDIDHLNSVIKFWREKSLGDSIPESKNILVDILRTKIEYIKYPNIILWKKLKNKSKNFGLNLKANKIKLNEKKLIGKFQVFCDECIENYLTYLKDGSAQLNEIPFKEYAPKNTFFTKLINTKKKYSKYIIDESKEEQFISSFNEMLALVDESKKGLFDIKIFLKKTKWWYNWQNWLILLGFLTGIGFCIYMISKLRKPKKETVIDKFSQISNDKRPPKKTFNIVEKRPAIDLHNKESFEEKSKRLEKELEVAKGTIEEQIEIIKNQGNSIRDLKRKLNQPSITRETSIPLAVNNNLKNIIKYALRPDGSNGFAIQNLSDNIEDQLFYVIESSSDDKAEYYLTNDSQLQISAAKSANSILKDACEYENLPRDTKTGIETTRNGQLKKQGQEWMIVEKAKIRFI